MSANDRYEIDLHVLQKLNNNTNSSLKYFINKAMKQAFQSKLAYQHGCVIVHNGTVVGEGCNEYRKSGYVSTYANKCETFTKHAEMSALQDMHYRGHNCKKLLPKSTLIVVRLPKKCKIGTEINIYSYENVSANECVNSKPCRECQKVLKKWNMGSIYHT